MTTPGTTKTDLLLLGLLLDRPMHGYELYQQIQSEGIDTWFNISAAGVYYSLGKLHDQGQVAETRQRRAGGSRKSIYRLTEEGRTTFFGALEAELASREEVYLDYDLVIYLLNRLPSGRAIPPMEQRQRFLADKDQEVHTALKAEQGNGRSPLKLAILDHKCRFLQMEHAWLADVISSIQEYGKLGDAPEGGQGFMVLTGDLQRYHLPDLLRLIVSGQHTGTLSVSDGSEVRTLTFEEGQPICASYLRESDPPRPVISCTEVMEGLCEVFRWREGRFTFDQRLEPPEWCVPLDCGAEELILRGCRKVDDWDIIQQLVPSGDTIFELGPGAERLKRLALTPAEGEVVAAVDGMKDVATVARELDLTLFETSRVFYCLAAIGVLRTADLDKIRLRRVFREIAELMCGSTIPWRPAPDDRSCEEEVNGLVAHLPLSLNKGRVEDRADPQLSIDELQEIYHFFLQQQFKVVSRRFGRSKARGAFEKTLRQIAPELQGVAKRYGFDRVGMS